MNKIEQAFSLTRVCKNCPFRKDDQAIDLQPGRKEEIIEGLLSGRESTFHCHKTVYREGAGNFDEDGNYTPHDVKMCPGAMAVARKMGRDPQMIQVAERMGWIPDGHYDQALAETLDPKKDLSINLKNARLAQEENDGELSD